MGAAAPINIDIGVLGDPLQDATDTFGRDGRWCDVRVPKDVVYIVLVEGVIGVLSDGRTAAYFDGA